MDAKKIKVRKFGFKDLLVILIFLLIAFVFVGLFWYDLMQTLNLQNVEPVGTVVIRRNTVQRRFSTRVVWDRLSSESPVYIGDLIRIAEDSAATLYVGGTSIEIEENSLIRILLAPDGESLIIQVSSGEVSIVATEEGRQIYIEVDGILTLAVPGEVLTATVTETGGQVQTSNVGEWLENTGRLASMTQTRVSLISPAVNSLLRYEDVPYVVNFRWEEIENAVFYEIEIGMTPELNFPIVRESFINSFMIETRLGEGTWFWRVRPVFSYVYNVETVFSDISFFRIVKEEIYDGGGSLSDWLAMEMPSNNELPPHVPVELIPANLIIEPEPEPEPIPPPPAPTPPTPPAPPPRLPAPRNMQPPRATVFGVEELRSRRNIEFSWSPVPEATAYILTLYQQTPSGSRQILRTSPLTRTNYTLGNLRLLDRGTFVWQIEAVATNRAGTIIRRGTLGESNFILDFPLPGRVEIEDTGILYGN